MTFHVGQKVVCVDDTLGAFNLPGHLYYNTLNGLKRGEIYTIRDVLDASIIDPAWAGGGGIGVRLVEIQRRKYKGVEAPYAAARFRPVQEQGMSILRAILANPKRELEVVE